MRIRLDYGIEGLEVDLPDERVTIIEPFPRASVPDPHAALTTALRAPLGRPPLRELARRGQTVAISVCDITRAQPRREMLEALFEEMPDVRPQDITILIATGTHRTNTVVELEKMLGADIVRRYRVSNHDSRDSSALVYVGKTTTGVPVHLNRAWMSADVRITTGFVEPHFFAGFSGGPKMVAPGLAGLETVLVLHDARRIGHPNATWGVTEGNPIHDDVREIARMVGVDFAVDVTLNRAHEITAVFAGDLFAEHRAACEAAKRDAMQAVDSPFDVVVTTNSGFPLDQNLYQAVKGMSAGAKVVKPGGTIVCAAECRDGLPSHGSYGQVLASQSSPEKLLAMINAPGYSAPDQWEVQIQAQIQMKASVLLKTTGLAPEAVRAAHFQPIDDVAAAVSAAMRAAGSSATLCVLPQGPQTIPYLRP
ncbi:MAG: nickel-dependent lactate racemase [Candidatus Rokubacteria bacterium]|nr:nickel-dependent lactate racemase [Candidatus Rokubacteria bacterium]